jgi:hypothetical protein
MGSPRVVDFKPGNQPGFEVGRNLADCTAVIRFQYLPQDDVFVPSLKASGMAGWDVVVERAVNEKNGHLGFRDSVFGRYFRRFHSVFPLRILFTRNGQGWGTGLSKLRMSKQQVPPLRLLRCAPVGMTISLGRNDSRSLSISRARAPAPHNPGRNPRTGVSALHRVTYDRRLIPGKPSKATSKVRICSMLCCSITARWMASRADIFL